MTAKHVQILEGLRTVPGLNGLPLYNIIENAGKFQALMSLERNEPYAAGAKERMAAGINYTFWERVKPHLTDETGTEKPMKYVEGWIAAHKHFFSHKNPGPSPISLVDAQGYENVERTRLFYSFIYHMQNPENPATASVRDAIERAIGLLPGILQQDEIIGRIGELKELTMKGHSIGGRGARE